MSVGNRKIIDFRNRPPLLPFKGLYDIKNNMLLKGHMKIKNRPANTASPVLTMVGKPGAMEQWWKEIDAAGIDAVVVNGRYAGGLPDFTMGNDTLTQLQKQYPGRFFGLSQINLDQDPDTTAREVEKAIKEQGMAGANLEPGYQTVGLGKMGTFTDDTSFWPILEVLSDAGAFLLIQTGLFVGTDISFNNPQALDRMLTSFPKLNVVLAHGGYPYIQEVLGLCAKWPQLHVSADVYMFWPDGFLYAMNLERIPEQLLFGSAFPFGDMKTTVDETFKLQEQFGVSDATMQQYLYSNAARLLKVDQAQSTKPAAGSAKAPVPA
jgi:uncharacterized protein